MDSKQYHDDDDNGLVFHDLMPDKPANAFQKRILHIQHNWNKRYLLTILAVLSSLLIIFLIVQSIHTYQQNIAIRFPKTNSSLVALTTTNVAQMLPYNNVVYTLTNQPPNQISELEALNAKTGALLWSYSHHNTEGIKLAGDVLFVQTGTDLIAFNANSRTQLWQHKMSSDVNLWQVDQGVLFTKTAGNLVTALDAVTGLQLWQHELQSGFWQVDNGIFYTTLTSSSGLSALNARSGQTLWSNRNIDQGFSIDEANINQDLAITNGNLYLQNNENQNIQAFDGQTGKILWQFNTHGTDFMLSANNGYILLSDVTKTQVEALNGQTGKMLWQHPGTINTLIESPNQTVILLPQQQQTDIIRTSDGSTLYHVNSSDALYSIENNFALFIHFPTTNSGNGNTSVIINIEAINISNGATIWSMQSLDTTPIRQNNAIEIVSTSNNSVLSLDIHGGRVLWEHTFAAIPR